MIRTLFLISLMTSLYADDYLIEEMEKLKSSLSKEDSAYGQLVSRLADLYFDESIQEGGKAEYRKKSLDYYNEHLRGVKKKAAKDKSLEAKLQFQIGRLYKAIGKGEASKKSFMAVLSLKNIPRKFTEQSNLYLGEYFEEKNQINTAKTYYNKALSLCDSVSSCNYVHYRLAWLHYKNYQIDQGLVHLKKSLFDKDKKVRKRVLNDLFLFMSNLETDGKKELSYIRSLSASELDLQRRLSESFFSGGNRVAGYYVLREIFKERKTPKTALDLLEESYALSENEHFASYLAYLESLPQIEKSLKASDVLARVIVQMDANVQGGAKEEASLLKKMIELQLNQPLKRDDSRKYRASWLKLERVEDRKLTFLSHWIQSCQSCSDSELKKLYRTRIKLSKKLNAKKEYREDLAYLSKNEESRDVRRKLRYLLALEAHNEGKTDDVIEEFYRLANLSKIERPDKWAILSKKIVLDQLNQKKNFSEIINQSLLWTTSAKVVGSKDKDVVTFKERMLRLIQESEFELATRDKDKLSSFHKFKNFCLKKVLLPQSCENAKSLAFDLKIQSEIVFFLERDKNEKALLSEYERMGEYAKAAGLFEKLELSKEKSNANYLKTALLWELAGVNAKRDANLLRLVKVLKKKKSIPKDLEALIYTTLGEAGLLEKVGLSMPWSFNFKVKIADILFDVKKDKKSKLFLDKQEDLVNDRWALFKIEKAKKLYIYQKKRGFYGRSSKWKFKKRVSRINKLKEYVQPYLNSSDLRVRITLLSMVNKAYSGLVEELMKTPIPSEVQGELRQQVLSQLQTIAAPFSETATQYKKLMQGQIALYKKNSPTSTFVQDFEAIEVEEYQGVANLFESEIEKVAKLSYSPKEVGASLSLLRKSPNNQKALSQLAGYFSERSQRLASYFKGRLENLKETGSAKKI